jgi:hypothetical protein
MWDLLLLTDTDNAQTLVDEDGVVGYVVAAPVGTAVLDLLAHANGRGPELLHIGVPVLLSVYNIIFFATTRGETYW